MNIIEAAKALKEGRIVRRSKLDRSLPTPQKYNFYLGRWADGLYMDEEGTVGEIATCLPVFWTIDALLAEDWEVVSEKWTVVDE